jgi:gamma-glutamyltranspeptidase/glutathione hydrolase
MRGGNAIDAALAAAAVLAVVYPHNTGLGGDLVALVRDRHSTITCINATGPAARAVEIPNSEQMPLRGPETITVPGGVAGWAALHAHGAALSWQDHFTLAREYAAGVRVVPGLAAAIRAESELIAADEGMREVFAPGGVPLREGDALRQPALHRTLSALAAEGADTFYRGSVARGLTSGLQRVGSRISTEDLQDFRPEVTAPLSGLFRGRRIHTSPPNTQGILLLQALGALEASEVADPLGADAGRLSEIFRRGIRDRLALLCDPRFHDVPIEAFLAPEQRAHPTTATGTGVHASGDTVAVVAVDSDGIAVSLLQSLFHGFGAGILDPGTGILLHNRGALFSLSPNSPNMLAPGKRPAHTLMPVMVTEADESIRWVNGTMGGRAQPQIHTQVLLRLLEGADPAEAVAAPRWIVGEAETGHPVAVEADVPATARQALGTPVAELPAHSGRTGHAQVVAVRRDGTIAGGSDPRADGSAATVIR